MDISLIISWWIKALRNFLFPTNLASGECHYTKFNYNDIKTKSNANSNQNKVETSKNAGSKNIIFLKVV